MSQTPLTRSIAVPGASIYVEQRGSGPTLLLIPGGDIGTALVAALGVQPTIFPGDHMGFGMDPAGFAAALGDYLCSDNADPRSL